MDGSSDEDSNEPPVSPLSTEPLTSPSTPSDSSSSPSFLTFFQMHTLDMDFFIDEEKSGYHIENICEPTIKRRRTNSGKVNLNSNETTYDHLQLSNGQILRFHEDDGLYLLIPYWFESNMYVRKIVSRISGSIRQKLKYMSKIIKEEEGYDDDGEMIYYHLRDQVYESYLVETRLRNAMRRVLMKWRNYKMDKRSTDAIDPITLSPAIKPVVIYDWSVKKKFVFEAKSIAIIIESKLLYHEGGFASPRYPCNPWTNLEFTYRQLLSIYYQLKAHGELRWGLTTLREHNFNKAQWHQYHYSAITIKAIQYAVKYLDSLYARELLEDFIITKISQITPVTEFMVHAYRSALIHAPDHWYLEKWKSIAYQHYEAQHFELNYNEHINKQCRILYKQHNIFIKDLARKNIIKN
jgi:hypothetical protein